MLTFSRAVTQNYIDNLKGAGQVLIDHMLIIPENQVRNPYLQNWGQGMGSKFRNFTFLNE